MKVITLMQDPTEIDRILRHLVKQGRPPPQVFAKQNTLRTPNIRHYALFPTFLRCCVHK